jgi:four helix bundle protein
MGRDFRKITAWQKADDLAVKIYEVTKSFPKDEIYALTSQLRRAAVSVPANIAEGSSTNHKKEYLRFLYYAKSSLGEVDYYLHLARRLAYLSTESYQECFLMKEEAARTLQGLIDAVTSEVRRLRSEVWSLESEV